MSTQQIEANTQRHEHTTVPMSHAMNNDKQQEGYWRGRPLSQTPAAIKARAQRAAYNEKVRLEKAAFDRAKAKLTEEEWRAVENHFADYDNYY